MSLQTLRLRYVKSSSCFSINGANVGGKPSEKKPEIPPTSGHNRCLPTLLPRPLPPLRLREPLLKLLSKCWKRRTEGEANRPKLNDIEPPLAPLAFADKRLSLVEPLSQLNLSHARLLA